MSVFSENDKDKILRDFQIQTDKQGLANKSDFVIYKKKSQGFKENTIHGIQSSSAGERVSNQTLQYFGPNSIVH